MEEFCSHPDPGTKSPSTPLEVSATFCAEVYSPLKTGRVAGHREVLVTMLVQMLDSLKGKPKKKQPKRKKNPDILLWQECKHLLSQDWGITVIQQAGINRQSKISPSTFGTIQLLAQRPPQGEELLLVSDL